MNAKLLILTWKLIYKNRKTFLILLAEMVLTTFIFMGIVGKMQMLNDSKELSQTFQDTNAFYFAPYQYYSEGAGLDIEGILSKNIKQPTQVGKISLVELTTADDEIIDGYAYNDTIISYANIKIKKGRWFSKEEDIKDYIPIIGIGDAFQLNESIDIQLKSGGRKKLKVVGIMDSREYILRFKVTASNNFGSLDNFIHLPELNFIVPCDCKDEINSIQKKDTFMYEEEPGKMIIADNQVTKEAVSHVTNQYGTLSDISGMKEKYKKDINDYLIDNGVSLGVFTLLSLIGIAGINGIQSILNEKLFVIYYMLGLTGKKCALIEALRSFSLILATYIVVIVGYRYTPMKNFYPREDAIINGYTFGIILLYLSCIYICTSAAFIKKLQKDSLIQLYKKNS